jgi:MFS family permease
VGSLAGSYAGGRLTDKLGANNIISGSLIIGGIFLILLQWAHTFNELAVVIFLAALFGESYRPALMASIRNFVPRSETGRSIALIRLAINLGFSAAPVIGGLVAISLGYKWLFWIDGLTCILAALHFTWRSRKWVPRTNTFDPTTSSTGSIAVPPYRNGIYMLLLFSKLFIAFAVIQWFQSVSVFMKSEWLLDERYYGFVMGLNGLMVSLFEMPLIHKIERESRTKTSIKMGILLIGASLLPFLLPGALIWCFLAVILFTVGEILYLPLINSIALNMSPDKKSGEYMAWFTMTWSVIHIIGPTLGLSFIDYVGFAPFWLVLFLLTGVSFLLHLKVLKRV